MTTNKFKLQTIRLHRLFSMVAAAIAMLVSVTAQAGIDGVTGGTYSLTASAGYISVPDGGSIYSWGYSNGGTMQLPGPTLKVTAGNPVSVTLTNNLPSAAGNVSIVFPGHEVTAPLAGREAVGAGVVRSRARTPLSGTDTGWV